MQVEQDWYFNWGQISVWIVNRHMNKLGGGHRPWKFVQMFLLLQKIKLCSKGGTPHKLYWLDEQLGWGGGRVGYSPGTREPGSHEIFRLTRNFCSISRCFGANLTSRSVFPVKWRNSSYHTQHAGNIFLSQGENSWYCKWLIATGRNLFSQRKKFLVLGRNFLS